MRNEDIEELLEMMDSKFYRTIAKGMTSSPKFFKTVARMLGENLPEDLQAIPPVKPGS